MLSTITSRFGAGTNHSPSGQASVLDLEPVHSGSLTTGFATLRALVSGQAVPANIAEEEHALRTLLHLHDRRTLEEALRAERDTLFRYVEFLGPEQTQAVLDLIHRAKRHRVDIRVHRCTDTLRFTLLFILLARVTGPVNRFQIVPILDRLGYWNTTERLPELLAWIPAPWCRGRRVRLARLYLTATRRILLVHEKQDGVFRPATGCRDFEARPQAVQMMLLENWREQWNRERTAESSDLAMTPAQDPERVEFHLARAGAFARLRRRGGSTARQVLCELGYRDTAEGRGTNARGLLRIMTLAGLVATVLFVSALQAMRLEASNRSLAAAVAARYPDPSTPGGPR